MFENLANRQVREQPHGEHDPENDFMSQRTLAGVDPAGGVEGLLNVLGADNLFQSRQPIHNLASVIGRQRTSSLMHESHPPCCLGGKQTQDNMRLGLASISTVLGLNPRVLTVSRGRPLE